MDWHTLSPQEIEKRSFEIISRELGEATIPAEQVPILKRVIHTTADFDYSDNLYFRKMLSGQVWMLYLPALIS